MERKVFPVVHVNTWWQAVDQSVLATEAGADGVYLIDHLNRSHDYLLETYRDVIANPALEGTFVGLNFLQHRSATESFQYLWDEYSAGCIARLPDGLWADNAETEKQQLLELRAAHPELAAIQYLGGVAFKYTRLYTDEPAKAAAEAVRLAPFVDIVTTSGHGTGEPPTPEKIAAMKAAIGEQKLAVASGIDSDNIASYGRSFDQLLVASSIERRSGYFDERKLARIIQLVHEEV